MAQLNMMAALFGQLNQNLNTTVGSLSIHGQTLADLGSAMRDVQMAQITAADAQRDLAQLVNANSSRPPPPPPGGVRRTRSAEMEVTEIPHTDPEADAAMDRAVVVAPKRRALSLEDHRDALRSTAAKIRKVTAPKDVIPDDVIPPAARGRSGEPQRSRLLAERRAGPYTGRPRPLAITDRVLEPPLQPAVAPPPPAAVLPTNGEHRQADYAQLREATHARAASAAPSHASHASHASAASGYRSRSRGRGADSQYQIVPRRPKSAPSPAPSGRPPSEEVGRAPTSSRAVSVASRAASVVSSRAPSSSLRSVSRVSQRSSRTSARSRSPYGAEAASSSVAVPVLQQTRALSAASAASTASVGHGPSSRAASADYARGQTPDKRFKAATGLPVRRSFLRTGRRARRTIYNEIANRD